MTDPPSRSGPASIAAEALFHRCARLCRRLSALESRLLRDALADVRVRAPVFVCGLARSGSTLVLEALAATGCFASPRYRDYPPVWFPYWWTHLRDRLPLPEPAPVQRAHGDGIEVTPDSPEAFDEIFWMHFFPDRHAETVDQVLDEGTANPAFEGFYQRHIRKLLLARRRSRYLSKGNYTLARLAYLHKLFPDARFVVAVRDPVGQVASLVRQNARFRRFAETRPGIGRQLARRGHFEFGPRLRAECLDDIRAAAVIADDFRNGRFVSGYAHQWTMSYGHLLSRLADRLALADAVLILRHEDLCATPSATLRRLAEHCMLDNATSGRLVDAWRARVRTPRPHTLNIAEVERVRHTCHAVAVPLGYD